MKYQRYNPGAIELKLDPGPREILPFVDPPVILVGEEPVADGPIPAGDRKIFWVHGLGGNVDSWSRATDATDNGVGASFPARQTESHRMTYTQLTDLYDAQTEVRNYIDDVEPNPGNNTRNFVIGHSQGGVVSRAMVANDFCEEGDGSALPYGGLVTFSSPLGGAQVINSTQDGTFEQLATEACQTLYVPFVDLIGDEGFNQLLQAIQPLFAEPMPLQMQIAIAQMQNDIFLGISLGDIVSEILQSNVIADLVEDAICPIIYDAVLFNAFSNVVQPIGAQYAQGSPVLTQNNSCTAPDLPKVAFYGVEPYEPLPGINFNNPILYRVMNYFGNGATSPIAYPHFGANDDSGMAAIADDIQNIFLGNSIFYEGLADFFQSFDDCSIQQWIENFDLCTGGWQSAYADVSYRAAAHRNAYEWFENINDQWMVAMGALEINQTSTNNNNQTCYCLESDTDPDDAVLIPYIYSAQDCYQMQNEGYISCTWTPQTTTITTTVVEKPSDGVVLNESAVQMTGAQYDPQEMRNSSHMQMRNNEALKDALLDLYGGNNGGFFKTDPK